MNGIWLPLAGGIWILVVFLLRRRCARREPAARYDLDTLAGGVLFLLTLGFFWRTASGDVFQPADGGDLASFLFPTYRFAASQLAQGNLPLWNPTLYGGAPFVADIQAGLLYLPNLLLFLLRPQFSYEAMQWLAIGHLFWAGLGAYVLLRVLRWPAQPVMRPAALFGAIAFQFSDPLLIHFGNLNLIAALSWMPWVLAAYALALDQRRPAWAGVAGILFALGAYAGHAQSTFYVAMALAVYTLLRALIDRSAPSRGIAIEQTWRMHTRTLARTYVLPLAIVALIALLLTAPILLPAMELTDYTERSDLAYQETVAFSLSPAQMIGLLTPGFFGRGPALHWGLWERVELPYAGVAALLMAFAAMLLATAETRRRLWPWVGLGLFGLVTGLGIYAIVHGWLTLLLPMFDQFRAPARALVLWTFAIAVTAAVGVDAVARRGLLAADPSARPGALRAGLRAGGLILAGVALPLTYLALLLTQENETVFLRVSVAALAIALAALFWLGTWALVAGRQVGWWSPRTFAVLAAALLYFDLAATGAYTDVSERDPTTGFRHEEIVAFLKAEPGPFRIDSMTGIESQWQPDTAALFGLQDLGGIANPLSLSHWHALLEATGGRDTSLYDMLNAAYVIAEDGTPLPDGAFELALNAPGTLSVYRNLEVFPRAWVVYEASTASGMSDALQAIQSADFDPARTAVVVADALPSLSAGADTGSAAVTDYGKNGMSLAVESGGAGLLVLSEVWYPGWRAWVNGVETPVFAANGGLRALAVPAGQSVVELRFQPRAWRAGLLLTAIGLLLLALWAVMGSLRRARHSR